MYDRYQGLIFDMDGTILDTEPTHRLAWHEVLKPYGMRFSDEVVVGLNGSPTWRVAEVLLNLHQRTDIDPHALAAEKMALTKVMLLDDVNAVRALPLIDVVKAYHGRRPMAVGTGSEHAMADALLRHLGVRDYFDAIVGADDVKRHKPEPDTFLRCAQLIRARPENCVVFEDADFGLQAAKAAGMDVVDVRQL